MVDVFLAMHKRQSALHQYSSGVFSDSEVSPGPLHELAIIFLFYSPSVIELSTLTCTNTTTMFECLDMDFCKTGTCSGLLC